MKSLVRCVFRKDDKSLVGARRFNQEDGKDYCEPFSYFNPSIHVMIDLHEFPSSEMTKINDSFDGVREATKAERAIYAAEQQKKLRR